MEAVSFPNPQVIDFIGQNFIPLRIPSDAEPIITEFNLQWTPTLVILDEASVIHHRTLGFYAPEDLIPMLLLALGKSWFGREKPTEAAPYFSKLVKDYPASDEVPEAIFLEGVSLFLQSHDVPKLKAMYERLQKEHPQSAWCKRAYPYRLL